MNRRERLLAGLVALLAVVMVLYFAWSSIGGALARRHSSLLNLQQKLADQQRTLRQADEAGRRLSELQKRSLPTDRERANSLYQQWLLNLVDLIGFVDPSVLVTDRRTRSGAYEQARFEVNGNATLDQLTDFLTMFYESADLHRIQFLSIKPVQHSNLLDVSIAVEAIILPGSTRTTVGDLAAHRYSADELKALRATILDRSIFFPANNPPKLEPIADQTVPKGSPLTVMAKASDPDDWDALEFVLGEKPPEGVKLEKRGDAEAELKWSPSELGEYTIELLVRDSGSPRREDKRTIRVNVVDPPKAEPTDGRRVIGFDDASQTFLVGTVANGEQRQAWFNVRTKGELLKLSQGESLDVGSVLGKIDSINETEVSISTGEGLLRVRVGQSLTEGKKETS